MNNILTQIKAIIEAVRINPLSPLLGIQRVIIGDPIQIPESTTSCIIIKPVSQEQEIRGNVLERIISTITISVIVDARRYMKNEITMSDNVTLEVMDIVNKLTTNNQSDELAIVGLLQKNIRLNNSCHDSTIDNISYEINERGDGKYEIARVTIKASVVANRPL